jgi:hypothetical protein
VSTELGIELVAGNGDTSANEIAVCHARDQLWLSWSRAALDREDVRVGLIRGGDIVERHCIGGEGEPAFRPALAALDSGVVIAGACRFREGRAAPCGLVLDGDAAHPWQLEPRGRALRLALAASGDRGWIAFEDWTADGTGIGIATMDATGRTAIVGAIAGANRWCRAPALLGRDDGGALLAWIEGPARGSGALRLARIGDDGAVAPIDLGGPRAAQTVALCAGPANTVAVAWQAPVADSVLSWLRLALVDARGAVTECSPPVVQPERREVAGSDQGWELPALACTNEGSIWLAGRSSHGFHLGHRSPDGHWAAPVALSPNDEWGGRGRGIAALSDAAGTSVVIARREWEGIHISRVTP